MNRVAIVVALTMVLSSSSSRAQSNDCIYGVDVDCPAPTPGTADNTVALIVVGSILGAVMVGSVVTLIAVQVWEANHLTWEHEDREREQARRDDEAIADRKLQDRLEAEPNDELVGDAPPAP